MHLPMFIEVLQSSTNADLQICRKIMAHLFRHQIAPLPFASSIYEVADVIHNLRKKDLAPALFIVNTFWAEEVLRDLDAMVGDTPILLLCRRLVSPIIDLLHESNNPNSAMPLQDLSSRQIAVCRYGAKTSDQTAEFVANALVQFAADGEFWHIQSICGMSSMKLKPIAP